jgi:DNA repair exonuclease SbcCD ATPase subunit
MNELTTLSTLAVEIDALNEQANIYANQAVIYAAKSGQKLLLAKAQCNHGEFKTWLNENCKLSYTTAKKYMQLVAARPDLLDSNRPLTGVLPSITQMIELLSADESVNEVVTAKIEAGEDVTIKEIQRLKKEAADLKIEQQSILLNLAGANDKIKEKQKRINWLEIDRKGVIEQNDELRNRDQAVIDAKVAEAKAQLILENQQAIADAKRERDNAQSKIERLKKERDNAQSKIERLKKERDVKIKNGIEKGLQDLDVEIRQKQSAIDYQKSEIEKLSQIKREIDVEVGALAIHKKAIERIKDNLSFLGVSFSDAFETNVIPSEVSGEWDAIFYAVSKLKKKMAEWRDSTAPLESAAIIGELVD